MDGGNTVKGQAQQVIELAKKQGITIQYVPRKKLDQMVTGQHQGVVAQVAAYEYAELDDLYKAAEEKMNSLSSSFWTSLKTLIILVPL